MRFKNLTLQGYKSFANKVEFLFPTGVTAIVGPNGSGKSNIADGIRWVMGEQRMSSLRGKSSADMIFAGGRRRARAGMAEVSMTLDNADGWLPIEFSEVTITRRAYRSGENEYLVNGSKVRLRDVSELLAEGGISRHTYTIIGQGLVDAALALRPQERRDLFEEAAGISVYRARREEALRRLEETQHNLERVYDILNEITPRLRRLEREVQRVEEHRRMAAHLERLQRTWYGYHWGRQQNALDRALERSSALESMVQAQQEKAATLSKRLVTLRQQESELRAKLRDWHRESADLHDRANDVRRELAVTGERIRLLKARREELLAEINPLDKQQTTQVQGVAQTRAQVEQLEHDLAEHNKQLAAQEREWRTLKERARHPIRQYAQVEQELRACRTELERLNEALAEAREQAARLASEQAVAEERARHLEARHAETLTDLVPLERQETAQAEQLSQAQTRTDQLRHDLAKRQEQLAKLEREWEAVQRRAQEPDQQRARLGQELALLRTQLGQLDQSLLEVRGEEARLTGELEALNRMHTTQSAYHIGSQALLQANLSGLLGPLATLIQVPTSWERAIEAALGSDLQAIVVEQASVIGEARSILASSGGRATLLPLDDLRPPPPLPTGTLCAADAVECTDNARPAVAAILGTVALCKSTAQARALLPAMPSGSRCVTPDGTVFRADGAIALNTANSSTILAEERARRELPMQLEAARQRRQEMEEEQRKANGQIAALESKLEQLIHQAEAARVEAARVEQETLSKARTQVAVAEEALRNQQVALKREQAALAQIRSQQAALRQQAVELEAERAAVVSNLQELRTDKPWAEETGGQGQPMGNKPVQDGFPSQLAKARQRCTEIEKRQKDVAEQIAALEKDLEELTHQVSAANEKVARVEREALAQARTKVAVTEEALRNQQTTLQREGTLLDRLQAQISARRQRIEELDAEQTTLAARIQELRAADSSMEARLRRVLERVRPAEEELEQLGKQQTKIEAQEQQARDRARDVEARYGRAQLDVDRCRDEINLLSRRIEEDLGLVELELADSVTAQTPLPLHPMVSELPIVEELPEGLKDEIQRLKARLRRLGGVNPNAPEDYTEVQERHQFLSEQSADLEKASEHLREVIAELDELMNTAFQETFDAIASQFSETFTNLFGGGAARLELTEPDDLMNTGVDIVARPPGKRAQRLALLSGGERSLTAVSLLFAILQISPAPFCVLDEVDAALDEANVGRFRNLLTELSQQTQFIVITHNRGTIEAADTLYGISMGADGVSQVVSLKMD
jgi:chromosome segregation protein